MPAVALLTAVGLDLVRPSPSANLPLSGLCDEAAHLATGLIVLSALPARPRAFLCGVLIGSVAIDVDHIPQEIFGASWLTEGTPRPYPHCLLTLLGVALVAAAARGWAREAAAGLLVGLTAHLFRDLAEGGSGVALLWPFSEDAVSIAPAVYYLSLLGLVGWTLARHSARERQRATPRTAQV